MEKRKGNIVKVHPHGNQGMIREVYKDWEDLKLHNDFLTCNYKDEWLEEQEKPFTEAQLNERWFSVLCLDGGSVWSCESRIEVINQLLN